MGLFDIFSSKPAGNRVELVSRRKFLAATLAAAPAAVAAAAAVKLEFVPEIREAISDELRKIDEMVEGDLGLQQGRIFVASPKQIFDPNVRVWRSVAAEAGAWADYVVDKTGVTRAAALIACQHLARLIDIDLLAAGITRDTKIDVHLPVVTRQWEDRWGTKQCQVGLGVHQDLLFDGSQQTIVTFKDKSPRLVDHRGQRMAEDNGLVMNA